MARPLRIDLRGGVYHVTSRGLERREIVCDDRDRAKWVDLVDGVARRRRWRVFAWALMTNHYHLFLETPDADLSAGMHDLNSGYVFGVQPPPRALRPLAPGAVQRHPGRERLPLRGVEPLHPPQSRPGRPGGPSAGLPVGELPILPRPRPRAGLAGMGGSAGHARPDGAGGPAGVREFLAAGVESPAESPLRSVVASVLLGSAGFVERMRSWLLERPPEREVPAARELRRGVGVEGVEAAVCAGLGATVETLREKRRWRNEARAIALYLCRRWTGETGVSLGERFGGVSAQAVSKLVAQVARRLGDDRRLAREVRRCEEILWAQK